ncbi:chaperonin 10-like protein [Mariannaea sp. PMI_226]|nr:chaperonin 10-like protein [Mariannaea sp. PMI_226]
MSNYMLQYQAARQGGPFVLATVQRPDPDPTDVSIRVKAVALNPLDWKMMSRGEMVQSWPATFGLDAAGVVERVGSQVTAFKPGDEVFSLCGIGGKAAGFQEVVTVPQHFVALKPPSCSFLDAASLPICYLTAAAAILFGLHVPIPHISPLAPGEPMPTPRSVLVLGGASAVGGAAIQMLRRALPNATIITTASTKHRERLCKLGATDVIDRHSSVVSAVAGILPNGVDAVLDCVTGAASDPGIFKAFSNDGLRIYSQVFTGQKVTVPDNVQSAVVFGRQVFGAPGGLSAMSALGQLVAEHKYQIPVPVRVIGNGWHSIGPGLQSFEKGVSGEKLVVFIED